MENKKSANEDDPIKKENSFKTANTQPIISVMLAVNDTPADCQDYSNRFLIVYSYWYMCLIILWERL